MRRAIAPFGWCFYSADFSLQAHGKNCYGRVVFIRDDDERKLWHQLPDELKDAESEKVPPLFVCGRGVTIEEAIKDAESKIANIPLIDSVEIATLKASYLNEVTE